MKIALWTLTLALITSSSFAGISGVSPAEFGDKETTKAYGIGHRSVIEIYGSQAKVIYDSLQVEEKEMTDYPGTKEKITADGRTRCWQLRSENSEYVMVTKNRCSVEFSRK